MFQSIDLQMVKVFQDLDPKMLLVIVITVFGSITIILAILQIILEFLIWKKNSS